MEYRSTVPPLCGTALTLDERHDSPKIKYFGLIERLEGTGQRDTATSVSTRRSIARTLMSGAKN